MRCVNTSIAIMCMSFLPGIGAVAQPGNEHSSLDELAERNEMVLTERAMANISSQMSERLSALERIVDGQEHKKEPLSDRAGALERTVFGEHGQDLSDALSVSERIDRIDHTVFNTVRGEEPFTSNSVLDYANDPRILQAKHALWMARNARVSGLTGSAVIQAPAARFFSGYQAPGTTYGYPYVYKGPGLPPFSYGAYPGAPIWWNSAYRRSGQPFYTGAPYFPWAGNRVGVRFR